MLNVFKVDGRLAPRRVLAATSLVSFGLLAFALYLQHYQGLDPCPMCVVQRYALIFVAVFAGLASASSKKYLWIVGTLLTLVSAGFGAFTAASQSWLQWFPPEVASCGRDLYGMIETFPLKRAIPMIFKGGGDCSTVEWTFLGGSIANWSFICFSLITLVCLGVLARCLRRG